MREYLIPVFAAVVASIAPLISNGAGSLRTNPPSECKAPDNKCGCQSGSEVSSGCIKVNLDLGLTTPWSGSLDCALKIFADNESPDVFTCDSLYAVLGGYTFKRLGQDNLSDGETPAQVVFSHPDGEPVSFIFKDGESIAQPDPGVHVKMDERLMMVDAEGWATTSDPVYYDLYVGDGSRRRFMAADMFGTRGKLVSITDARGNVMTPEDMGVDIVYDSNGVRQFLTPSRLADVVQHPGFTGYDVTVYPLQDAPQKDAATGLYALPSNAPVKRISLRRADNGKRAVVTLRSGDAEAKEYVFDYVMRDWSLTYPSGSQDRKEIYIDDERAACTISTSLAADGRMLSRSEAHYKWMSWGFAMTNRVEGFGGVTDTTSWTYYTSGNGKGQVRKEIRQSGLTTEYAYDSVERIISETRAGPGMMTETTTYDYAPVDQNDPVLPVDTRPRTIVRKLDGIECERTYYAYMPLTNIVERAGAQGASYGSTNALRTVTTFYPPSVGSRLSRPSSGRIAFIRHEDGKLDFYDYSLASNLWTETVTHLHEQSPSPVSGKTKRDIVVANARGEVVEKRTEAFIDGTWHAIARNRMAYDVAGKRISLENLAGQVTTTAWDCCHKTHETEPDGSTATWNYDGEGRIIAASRLVPLDMTNVTWLATCYAYDDIGRQTATWQTNYAFQAGLPATRTRYDALGRIAERIDTLGNATKMEYSPDGRTVSVRNPNTSTRITTRSADGDTLSVTGTAATPEFHTCGILHDGTRWTKIVQGETPESPRFTKRYENMLGQTIREERSGFQGAVLATAHTYDAFGRLVATTSDNEPTAEYAYDAQGDRSASVRRADGQWRKTETVGAYAIEDGNVWLVQTNIVSCSDSSIAPLVSSSSRQLTGLTADHPSRTRSTDIRGNTTESELRVSVPVVVSSQIVPYATNRPLTVSRYGVPVMDVSVSEVTNTVAYDALGRQISYTDGRGNTRRTEYNAAGQRSASIDALGNCTTYAYDQFGNLAAVTNPLGNATVYEYDLRGRKTYEGGATYPVRYTYDVFGDKTTMMTYRNESLGPDSGDVTTWLYDEASGCMTNKVYADGKGPAYSYTPDGKLSQRVWARGIVTEYAYDGWGNFTNTVYSDDTPAVSLAYDALGRQTEARDAAGVATFAYDDYGALTNETVVGVAGTNTIKRYWDAYGRTAGYVLNETRQTTIGYCPATGRIESMLAIGSTNAFHWSYVPGSDIKAQLLYPNGLTASWQYDAAGQLLQVCNATPTNIISQYDYNYDAAGRRAACAQSGSTFEHADVISYAYNARSELINATDSADTNYLYSYEYDDIGNRISASEQGTAVLYSANELNQYASIDDFTPEYDEDGNQTLIETSTGIWQVTYNGENRPVLWECDSTNIVMSFDRMGRRVKKNDLRFIYDGYLQIADSTGNSYTWDPTEPVATRPLVGNFSAVQPSNFSTAYYTHDGNKNVSDLIASDDAFAAHYEYTPFGFIAAQRGLAATANPWRFASEFVEADTATVYYNYRHCEVTIGRWLCRDPIFERAFKYYSTNRYDGNEYLCGRNDINIYYDWLGLDNPGCDIPPSIVNGKKRDCLRRCCAKHDECYYSRGGTSPGGRCRCTANSWFKNAIDLFLRSNDEQEAYPNDPCKQCNSDVVRCFASCYVDNDKGGPRWFCPNGDHAGEFYDDWSEIPPSCFEAGIKPYWPPDEDPPPQPPPLYYRPSMPEAVNMMNDVFL